ncbi:MAG: TIGR02449 family protein [Pseudomonadota bacterium]
MANKTLESLEKKIDALVILCQTLKKDKAKLYGKQQALLNEYDLLREKHRQAVAGVEQTIAYLKKMERHG